MRESSFEKIDIIQGLLFAHDLAKTLDLAFSLEVDDDLCVLRAPLLQARGKLRAFSFDEYEITDRELADFTILERAAKIFRTVLNPAFADFDLWSDERARRGRISAIHYRLDLNL